MKWCRHFRPETNRAKGKFDSEENKTLARPRRLLPRRRANYLFYSSMVVHFLGFAHKFIHSDVALVLLMVYKVLEVLSSSPELLDLLHKVDAAYHSRLVTSSPAPDDVLKYVPSIREQLKDWEDGLSESDADGSFLHEHWNSDLRLFSNDENGAYNLLQLLLIRAESEILRVSGDTQQEALQTLDSIKSQMKRVFQGHTERAHRKTELHNQHQGREEIFTPKHPCSGKSSWADVKYRGDWMKRPISEMGAVCCCGCCEWCLPAWGDVAALLQCSLTSGTYVIEERQPAAQTRSEREKKGKVAGC